MPGCTSSGTDAGRRRTGRRLLDPDALHLAGRLAAAPFVDQHCHSLLQDWATVGTDAPRWRRCFTEGRRARSLTDDVPAMRGYSEFLASLATYLGMPGEEPNEGAVAAARDRRAPGEPYLRELLADAGITTLLVDTGYGGNAMLAASSLAERAGVQVRTVVRIESLAERVLADDRAGATPGRFVDAIGAAIEEALDAGAVGMKTIAAYRSGLDLGAPSVPQVRRGLRDRARQAKRLSDAALVATVVRTAAQIGQARRVPLQVHTGFGDDDLQLPRADPSLLGTFLREPRFEGCPVVLLHCYPFVAQAASLASIHPGVHVDLSLTIPLLGAAGARRSVAEALALCPTTKLLAGTDGHSYPEMHWRGATLWRETLAVVLGAEVAERRMTAAEATATGEDVLAGNARRLYRLT